MRTWKIECDRFRVQSISGTYLAIDKGNVVEIYQNRELLDLVDSMEKVIPFVRQRDNLLLSERSVRDQIAVCLTDKKRTSEINDAFHAQHRKLCS